MLDHITTDRARATTKETLRALIDTATQGRKIASEEYDSEHIAFFYDMAQRAHYEPAEFSDYLTEVTLDAESRGLNYLQSVYKEYKSQKQKYQGSPVGLPDYSFDFNKVWRSVGPRWKDKFYDWHEFIQLVGCDMVDGRFITDFMNASLEFEKSLRETQLFYSEDRAGLLSQVQDELKKQAISIADVKLVRNVPGSNESDVWFYFVLYPGKYDIDAINQKLSNIVKTANHH